MKKPVLLLLLPVSVLFALGGQAVDRQPQTGFSRTRWLEEQMERGARTPDNLVPENPRRLATFLDQLARTRQPATGIPKGVVRVSQDILSPDGGSAQPETETEPFLAVDPENPKHLLASYQEDRFPNDGGCRILTSAVSFNGGATWQESLLPGLTVAGGGPYERTSDPWVAFGSGGRAYFAALGVDETRPRNGVYLSSSDDGGLTWSDPVAVHTGDSTQTFDDKEAVVVDTRDDSPYKGRVYVGWDMITISSQAELITYSDDGGLSFQPPVTLAAQGASLGVIPLVGPGGIVHAVWLNFRRDLIGELLITLQASHSTDGGQTWSVPVIISGVQASGVAGSRTAAGLPSAAVDGRTGALYVVWQDERFTPSTDQAVLSSSTDGGQTWSLPIRISDGPADAPNFTPMVAVTPEGWVGVSYYSLRNNASHVLVDEYLSVSKNGGRSFAKSLRVTASSSDLRFAATSDGFFLGDYQGLATSSKTFYPLWTGTYSPSRLDPSVRQPDIFTRALKVR